MQTFNIFLKNTIHNCIIKSSYHSKDQSYKKKTSICKPHITSQQHETYRDTSDLKKRIILYHLQ